MYDDTIDGFVKAANAKLDLLRRAPHGFFVGCILAGAYIGLGILLILSLGSHVPPDLRPLVMGATFGIALILVVIAGAELFTGHTMVMSLRRYRGQGSWAEAFSVLGVSWVGNLCGAAVLVGLFVMGGGGGLLDDPQGLLMTAAAHKMNGTAANPAPTAPTTAVVAVRNRRRPVLTSSFAIPHSVKKTGYAPGWQPRGRQPKKTLKCI